MAIGSEDARIWSIVSVSLSIQSLVVAALEFSRPRQGFFSPVVKSSMYVRFAAAYRFELPL